MKTVTRFVRVTKRDVELGKKRDETACPIAHALNRILAPGYRGFVSTCFEVMKYRTTPFRGDATKNDLEWVETTPLPEPIYQFITKFDAGKIQAKGFRPIECPVELPEEAAL